MAINIERRLFILFDYRWIKNYIFIANSANMPPTRSAFNGKLFIIYYEKISKKIIPLIAAKRYLNFFINETFNIYKE